MKMIVRKPTQAEIDSTANWETWTGEPSVFPYNYEQAEAYLIMEGKAKVKDSDGNEIHSRQVIGYNLPKVSKPNGILLKRYTNASVRSK